MKLSTIQRTIRLALVTLLSATVVVACGPDKNKHRMPMKTGARGIDPKTGLPLNGTQSAEQQKKLTEDLKNRNSKIGEIDGRIAQAKSGQATDKNSLDEGTYTLDGVITYFKYMNNSDDMRVYREHGIQNSQLTDIPNTYKATGFVASFSDTPRHVEVPLKLNVDRSQNQDWLADANIPLVNVRSEVVQNSKEVTFDLRDENINLDNRTRVKASVLGMLASAQIGADKAYSIKDENNKGVYLRLIKVSDSRLNIVFDIDEAVGKPLKARTIVLSYSVQKKVAAAQQPAQQQQPAAQAQAQAPATTEQQAAPAASAIPGVDDDQNRR